MEKKGRTQHTGVLCNDVLPLSMVACEGLGIFLLENSMQILTRIS